MKEQSGCLKTFGIVLGVLVVVAVVAFNWPIKPRTITIRVDLPPGSAKP